MGQKKIWLLATECIPQIKFCLIPGRKLPDKKGLMVVLLPLPNLVGYSVMLLSVIFFGHVSSQVTNTVLKKIGTNEQHLWNIRRCDGINAKQYTTLAKETCHISRHDDYYSFFPLKKQVILVLTIYDSIWEAFFGLGSWSTAYSIVLSRPCWGGERMQLFVFWVTVLADETTWFDHIRRIKQSFLDFGKCVQQSLWIPSKVFFQCCHTIKGLLRMFANIPYYGICCWQQYDDDHGQQQTRSRL
jgi:hypothetical protein